MLENLRAMWVEACVIHRVMGHILFRTKMRMTDRQSVLVPSIFIHEFPYLFLSFQSHNMYILVPFCSYTVGCINFDIVYVFKWVRIPLKIFSQKGEERRAGNWKSKSVII